MRILALETVGMSGSVAALEDSQVLRAVALPTTERSARALAPALRQLLVDVGWNPRQVQLVAVIRGPGSFTGLRVGVTTAKVLAYTHQAALVAVDTLEVLAAQVLPRVNRLITLLDAGRGQFFAAEYSALDDRSDPRGYLCQRPPYLLDSDELLTRLDPKVCLSGPPLAKLVAQLPAEALLSNPAQWQPRAATAGVIAYQKFAIGERTDPLALVPLYLRPSAAEEKLRESARCQTNLD